MPRVLITGAAGFIGMHTAISCLNAGWKVVGLDNLNDYYSVELKKDRLNEIEKAAQSVKGEFIFFCEDLNSDIWQVLKEQNIDALIHLAAQAGVRYSIENPMAYLESNILGFQKVLNFVAQKKIERFIYASSSSVYGKDSEQPFKETAACSSPESYYAATKRANELMAQAYYHTHGVKSIGMRFFTVYGPWGRPDMAPMLFSNAAFNSRPIKVFNYGKQKRDFTYIDDVINGMASLLFLKEFPAEPEIFNIGNGSPVALMDFISCIENFSLTKIKKEFVKSQNGDVSETYADTTKLFSLTGFTPSTDIIHGMNKFLSWYKEYYKIV